MLRGNTEFVDDLERYKLNRKILSEKMKLLDMFGLIATGLF